MAYDLRNLETYLQLPSRYLSSMLVLDNDRIEIIVGNFSSSDESMIVNLLFLATLFFIYLFGYISSKL